MIRPHPVASPLDDWLLLALITTILGEFSQSCKLHDLMQISYHFFVTMKSRKSLKIGDFLHEFSGIF